MTYQQAQQAFPCHFSILSQGTLSKGTSEESQSLAGLGATLTRIHSLWESMFSEVEKQRRDDFVRKVVSRVTASAENLQAFFFRTPTDLGTESKYFPVV